jgi:predicted amidohydrolase
MATTAPASAIGRAGSIGTLSPGAVADVAVLAVEEGRHRFIDSFGVSATGRQRLVPVATIREGRRLD